MSLKDKKVAFLFPGQGSQFIGMGKSFAKDCNASEYFEEADKTLNFPISDICWNGPAEKLGVTENTQPALLLTGYAAAKLLEKKGIVPSYVAGHSLGEYTALAFSGALNFIDALRLVRKRGELMGDVFPSGVGKMAALLGIDKETVSEVVKEASKKEEKVEIANLNCPGQIVIGGHKNAVLLACKLAGERGARRSVVLDVSVPSHTSLMEPMKEAFKKALDKTEIMPLGISLINNIEAKMISKPEEIKESLVLQLTQKV